MYVLNEFIAGGLMRQFVPFSSQEEAMNFVENERQGKTNGWSVAQKDARLDRGPRRSKKEWMLLGWRASPINEHEATNRVAQSFAKGVLSDFGP
jgi:hypothetical protein